MNTAYVLGCASIALVAAAPVQSQETSMPPEAVIADTAVAKVNATTAKSDIAAVEPVCSLHVFPTIEGQAQTTGWLSALGAVGAVADAASNANRNVSDAEYLRDALGPQFQVSAFREIDMVEALGLPEGTEVIYETPIADRKITTKVKTRLTDSGADCYAEFIVTQNLYMKTAIYGRSLNNRFIFKDFRDGATEAKLVKGRGGNGLSLFPPETPEGRDAADGDLRQAFLANFSEYAARFD